MKEHNRQSALRPALLAVGLIGSLCLLSVISAAEEGGPRRGGPPAGVTAAHYFKNIKVLKTLPANQLLPTMQLVSRSLGVNCGFCHAGRDFASDAKPEKRMARQMIVMTASLNAHQKILDKHATCFMCHHGHSSPETAPGAGGERDEDRPPPGPGQ